MTDETYDATSIRVVDFPAAVRTRPGTYFGGIDERGVHHGVLELLANSVDEALAGHARRIWIRVSDGAVHVTDDGRGIPVHTTERGELAFPAFLTEGHDRPTADGHHPHVHLAGHGVGIAAINVAGEFMEVVVDRGGARHRQRFQRGVPVHEVERTALPEYLTSRTGTTVSWAPDPEIFDAGIDELEWLHEFAWRAACLAAGTWISVGGRVHTAPDGLKDWMLAAIGSPLPVFHVRRTTVDASGAPMWLELAVCWPGRQDTGEDIESHLRVDSFVSMAPSIEGGAHVDGLRRGLATVADALGRDLTRGCRAVVHVGLYDSIWAGPTCDRLTNPDVAAAVARVVEDTLPEWLATTS